MNFKNKMMKKLLTVLFCLIFVVGSYAQKPKEDAPAAAKSAFAAKYPTAQKVKWSVEKPGEFEVEFTLNKVESSALFDASGKFLESETEVSKADLPAAVNATISKDFAGYKLDEIEKSTDAKGAVTFEMEAVKGKDKLAISFDATGKLISKEPLKKESEEGKK
jgi:hypothetical protein